MITRYDPNGEPVTFDDDMSEDEINSVMSEQFGQSNQGNEQKDKGGLLQSLLRYGIKDPLAGAAQLGNSILNIPGNISSAVNRRPVESLQFRKGYDYSKGLGIEDKNLADQAIQFAPELGAFMAMPAARIPGLASRAPGLAKVAGTALSTGALTEALGEHPESTTGKAGMVSGSTTVPFSLAGVLAQSKDPRVQLAAKLMGAVAGGGIGHYLSKQFTENPYIKSTATGLSALVGSLTHGRSPSFAEKIMQGMQGTENKALQGAAQRLGANLRPSELSQSAVVRAHEKGIKATPEHAAHFQASDRARDIQHGKSIEKLEKTIFDPKMNPLLDRMYKQAYKTNMPESSMKEIRLDPVIQKAEKFIKKNPAFQKELKDVPPNSVHYWDLVKRAANDMSEAAPKQEARIINQSVKKLTNTLDKKVPMYAETRALAQRKKLSEDLAEHFKSQKKTGYNFEKFFKDDEAFNKFQKNLRNVPEAQQAMKDWRIVSRALIKPPIKQISTHAVKSTTEKIAHEPTSAIEHIVDAFKTKSKGGEAINLITDPKWQEKLPGLVKIAEDKALNAAEKRIKLGKALARTMTKEPLNIEYKYNQPIENQ